MEKPILDVNPDHEYALDLVKLAEQELSELLKRHDATHREIIRLKELRPALPQYQDLTVQPSTKGMGNPGVMEDSVERYYRELERRKAAERAKAWNRVKGAYADECKRIDLQVQALYTELDILERQIIEAREYLNTLKKALFTFNPQINDLPTTDEQESTRGILWRGTLLGRVAITRITHNIARIDALRPGIHHGIFDGRNAYDFTPNFEVALRYARHGSGNDIPIEHRHDPIVIGFTPPSRILPCYNERDIEPANEGEAGNVIAMERALINRHVVLLAAL